MRIPWNKGGGKEAQYKKYSDYIKQCTTCNEFLHYSHFAILKKQGLGGARLLSSKCVACNKSVCKKWYEDNKERALQKDKDKRALKRQEKEKVTTYPLYKVCADCKEEKWHTEFPFLKSRKGSEIKRYLYSCCKPCNRKRVNKKFENPEKKKQIKQYQQKNKEKIRLFEDKNERYHYCLMTDQYIIKQLRQSKWDSALPSLFPHGYKFPQWLIQAKREHLRLERLLNNKLRRVYERKLTQFCQEFPELAVEARPSLQRLREWNPKSG